MLAAAVHAGEGLFVQEADEAVALGALPQNLHDEHVVVHGEVELLKDGGELELRRRDLVVARLGGDAEAPEFALRLLHELQHARADGAEVVVLQLLVLGRRRAEERAPGLHEVGALEPEGSVHKEVLLLGAERHAHRFVRKAEAAHEPGRRLLERLDGAQ